MSFQETKGIDEGQQDEFTPVAASDRSSTKSPVSNFYDSSHDKFGVGNLLNSYSKDPVSISILLSIVGYILIAAFGGMDSLAKYFGYIFFILFSLLALKVSKKQISDKRILTWIFAVGALLVVLSVGLVIYTYFC